MSNHPIEKLQKRTKKERRQEKRRLKNRRKERRLVERRLEKRRQVERRQVEELKNRLGELQMKGLEEVLPNQKKAIIRRLTMMKIQIRNRDKETRG